jgi:hypothetical protein
LVFTISANITVTSGANLLSYVGVGLENFVGGELNDIFHVTPSVGTPYNVNAGNGLLDVLNYHTTAIYDHQATTIEIAGHAVVTYGQFESVLIVP